MRTAGEKRHIRRQGAAVAAALGVAIGLVVWQRAGGQAGADGVRAGDDATIAYMLSAIDYVPDRDEIDALLGPDAASRLVDIARGNVPALSDPGVRIGAYRGLLLYAASSEAETVLREAVQSPDRVNTGVTTLYLRAAMESYAHLAGEDSVPSIAPMLDHPSLDVRAAAARALGETGAESAKEPLNQRKSKERSYQVNLAINEALRKLNEATGGAN